MMCTGGVVPDWLHNDGKAFQQKLLIPGTKKRKLFGILERPNLPPSISHITYKIFLCGHTGVGKTATVCRLAGQEIPRHHYETVGIQITNVYWPVKLGSRPTLFKLELWDAGEAGLKRYNHILPACKEGVDGIFVCFSSTDRGSWVELPQLITKSAQMADRAAVFAVATKFDQHAHSEISEPEIEAFEAEHGIPVIRMSNVYTPDKDELREIAPTLNLICDKLWKRDQELLTVK